MLATLPKDASSVPSTCHDCLSLQLQGDLTPFAMGTDTHMTCSHTNITHEHAHIFLTDSFKGRVPLCFHHKTNKVACFLFFKANP